MRTYTAFARGDALRLVAEGWSVGAFVLGPVWLAARGAWLAAFAVAILELALGRAAAAAQLEPWPAACLVGVIVGLAMFGHELCRLELSAGGWRPVGIVVGRGADEARLRLLDRR